MSSRSNTPAASPTIRGLFVKPSCAGGIDVSFASRTAELLGAIDANPTNWLDTSCWQLLNRIGKREQASLQAEMLCRAGEATESELNSLMRRTVLSQRFYQRANRSRLSSPRTGSPDGNLPREYRTALNTLQSWQNPIYHQQVSRCRQATRRNTIH